jgi:hypothetical protein
MKKQNKSDFTVAVIIKDFTGHIIDYAGTDWTILLYVKDSNKLTANCADGVLSENCEIVTETDLTTGQPVIAPNGDVVKKVLIYVDGFDWGGRGAVTMETNVKFPNEKFSDGIEEIPDKQVINLVIE